MDNGNKDLLDLCRLNLMEEHIQDSPANDRDATLKTIEWKKRHLMTRMEPSEISPDVVEKHEKWEAENRQLAEEERESFGNVDAISSGEGMARGTRDLQKAQAWAIEKVVKAGKGNI